MSGHYFHTKLRHPLMCNAFLFPFFNKNTQHRKKKLFVDSFSFILPELFIDITNTSGNMCRLFKDARSFSTFLFIYTQK